MAGELERFSEGRAGEASRTLRASGTLRPPWEWALPGDLLDPETGRPLGLAAAGYAGAGVLSAGGAEWPLLEVAPFLRVNRDALRDRAAALLRTGARDDRNAAEELLLTDRDDFAPGEPPTPADAARVAGGESGFRWAMDGLKYGPVAHYFAHRPAVPTFLSGLALLALAPPPGSGEAGGVVELCCGAGHFLRHLAGRRGNGTGTDVVFSKLWLASLFVAGAKRSRSRFLCCDASAAPVPLPDGPADGAGRTVFCHDALYFLPDKLHVLREMKRLAGPGGAVLVGHAHNSAADHGDVAGSPRTPAEYLALFERAGMPGPDLYDDAELAESCLSVAKPEAKSADELAGCEAIAAVWPGGAGDWDHGLTLPADGTPLSLNPLLVESDGTLQPDWPLPRFAEEYRSADYLAHRIADDERAVIDAAKREPVPMDAADAIIERLARRRILLDVPEGW